jgi:phosphate transport system permease protein
MASVDYSGPLTPTGNLRRRRVVDRLARGSATAAAFLAVAILLIFIYSIVQHGASVISFSFLTKNPLETFSVSATRPSGGSATQSSAAC